MSMVLEQVEGRLPATLALAAAFCRPRIRPSRWLCCTGRCHVRAMWRSTSPLRLSRLL
jgi:hypothetical protein